MFHMAGKESIPKIIHYCWVGGGPLSDDVIHYIQTWKEKCSGYQIIEWNSTNFDMNINPFVSEAYASKKWAFVSDYVRLYVLYNYGGIYLDTDVEVVKEFDKFLDNPAFIGFESKSRLGTAIIGSKKENPWIKHLLSYYDNKHFLEDGIMDMTPNPIIITDLTVAKYGLEQNNSFQEIDDLLVIYPQEYFSPKDVQTGIVSSTINTHTIHHFSASWCDESRKMYNAEKLEITERHPWIMRLNKTEIGCGLLSKIIPAWAVYNVSGFKVLVKKIIEEFKR